MRAQARFVSMGLAAVALAAGGCSSPSPPPADSPPSATSEPAATAAPTSQAIPVEPVDSGKACAKAEAQCGGGVCEISLDNTCAEPVTCNLAIVTVCQGQTDLMQAKGRTRDTFAAQKKSKMSISATCNEGRIVSTRVDALECK